jgi:hypothetical protein
MPAKPKKAPKPKPTTLDELTTLFPTTFHKLTKKHLALSVAEFEFRYNNRLNPNIFGPAVRMC